MWKVVYCSIAYAFNLISKIISGFQVLDDAVNFLNIIFGEIGFKNWIYGWILCTCYGFKSAKKLYKNIVCSVEQFNEWKMC